MGESLSFSPVQSKPELHRGTLYTDNIGKQLVSVSII